ncbi:hypothetical protein HOY80DRAFT_609307 [Tuber brumale]|nr:hypothetical protein HOY80DRAFT_609307 [Tuber brumale]
MLCGWERPSPPSLLPPPHFHPIALLACLLASFLPSLLRLHCHSVQRSCRKEINFTGTGNLPGIVSCRTRQLKREKPHIILSFCLSLALARVLHFGCHVTEA